MPSENGWEPAKATPDQCEWIRVPGAEHVSLQLLKGQPLTVMRAFAADFHAHVEPLRDADSAGWTPTNSVPTSNHLNGTGMDLNWNGADGRTFRLGISEQQAYPDGKAKRLRELLTFYEDTIYCGGFWSIKDWMHFQMGYNTYGDTRTADFIRRKIRADGFSTFKRGDAPERPLPNLVDILREAMGGSLPSSRYAELLPSVQNALAACGCHSVERIAMWMAQVGHESAGLRYMEEIASGAAYEGRVDLGNTRQGDGMRFKGRGPIQVTGRHNFTKLSQWAHDEGLVPTPTFFVDNPTQLSSDKYGFLGVVWYWTVARPQINSMADRNDLEGVTRAINGGLNGLSDRRSRWSRCKAMGGKLLALTTTPTSEEDGFMSALTPEEQRALYDEIMSRRRSRSPLRKVGSDWSGDMGDVAYNTDGSVHVLLVYLLAVILGDPDSIQLLREVAVGREPGRLHDARIAQAMLNVIDGRSTTESAPPTGSSVGVEPVSPPPPAAPPVVYPLPQAPVAPRQVDVPEVGLLSEITSLTAQLRAVSDTVTNIVQGKTD